MAVLRKDFIGFTRLPCSLAALTVEKLAQHAVSAPPGLFRHIVPQVGAQPGGSTVVDHVDGGFRQQLHQMRPAARLGMHPVDTALAPEWGAEARALRIVLGP